jgi:hypothetical protein
MSPRDPISAAESAGASLLAARVYVSLQKALQDGVSALDEVDRQRFERADRYLSEAHRAGEQSRTGIVEPDLLPAVDDAEIIERAWSLTGPRLVPDAADAERVRAVCRSLSKSEKPEEDDLRLASRFFGVLKTVTKREALDFLFAPAGEQAEAA